MTVTRSFPPSQRACAFVALSAMVATPLFDRSSTQRVVLTHLVIAGMFGLSLLVANRSWGARRAVSATIGVLVFTWLLEIVGSATGVPFGSYEYTTVLQPQLLGVPVVVPFAWMAMAVASREVARVLGFRRLATRVAVGAVALTAWDLFLDPQMVSEGYWKWAVDGWYRGIPLTNYGGWLIGGMCVMTIFEFALPHDEAPISATPVVHYAAVGVMEAVAFAYFFGDRVVALVGSVAMLPLAGVALIRLKNASRV